MAAATVNVASHRHFAVAVRALDAMAWRSRTKPASGVAFVKGAELADGTWHAQAPTSLHTGTKPSDTGYANPIVHGIRQPRGIG